MFVFPLRLLLRLALGDLDNDNASTAAAPSGGDCIMSHFTQVSLSLSVHLLCVCLYVWGSKFLSFLLPSFLAYLLYMCVCLSVCVYVFVWITLSVCILFWGVKLLIAKAIVFFQQILTLNDLVVFGCFPVTKHSYIHTHTHIQTYTYLYRHKYYDTEKGHNCLNKCCYKHTHTHSHLHMYGQLSLFFFSISKNEQIEHP